MAIYKIKVKGIDTYTEKVPSESPEDRALLKTMKTALDSGKVTQTEYDIISSRIAEAQQSAAEPTTLETLEQIQNTYAPMRTALTKCENARTDLAMELMARGEDLNKIKEITSVTWRTLNAWAKNYNGIPQHVKDTLNQYEEEDRKNRAQDNQ